MRKAVIATFNQEKALIADFSVILYNFKLREGWFEALFNIRGALDTVMDGAHGAVSVFSLDGVIDQDSEQFSGNFPPLPGHRTM